MALDTFANLKLAIAQWLKPNTSLPADETASRIPEYVRLVEAEANRVLKNREMAQTTASLTVTSGVAALPSGFLAVRSLRQNASPYLRIKPMPVDDLDQLDPSATGEPQFHAIDGESIYFWPAITTTVKHRWRKAITNLSADGDTNWLLTSHPDFYLYGALKNADKRLVDPERLSLIEPGFNRALFQLQALSKSYNEDGIQPMPNGAVV